MASAFLYRTQTTGTSTKKFTFSCWAKLDGKAGVQGLLSTSNGWADGTGFALAFSSREFRPYNGANGVGGSNMNKIITTGTQARIFADPAAWMHLHFQADTDESAIADRLKIYINGELQTVIQHSGSDLNYPAQGASWQNLGVNGQTMQVGRASYSGSHYFGGQLAHVHFADGQAYAPTVFGETDSTTGIWKPITSPTVTYGNNGFFLKFDNSANMGLDSAGSNNLTVSGTIVQRKDTPTNNMAQLNGRDNFIANTTLSNAGSTAATNQSAYAWLPTTMGMQSGKYYFETKLVSAVGSSNYALVGIVGNQLTASNDYLGKVNGTIAYYGQSGVYNESSSVTQTSDYASYTAGDIIGVALDLDNFKLYFSKNGTWQNSGDPTSGSTGTGALDVRALSGTGLGAYYFAVGDNGSNLVCTFDNNFGQGTFGTSAVASPGTNASGNGVFEYDVPTGYTALSTKGLNK